MQRAPIEARAVVTDTRSTVRSRRFVGMGKKDSIALVLGAALLACSSHGNAESSLPWGGEGPEWLSHEGFTQPQGNTLAPASEDAAQVSIIVRHGILTVSLKNAPLKQVLTFIGQQGGIEIRLAGSGGHPLITDSFMDLPLEVGLRRLLEGVNHVLVYSAHGSEQRIAQVFVMSGSGSLAQSPAASGAKTDVVAEAMLSPLEIEAFEEHLVSAIAAGGWARVADWGDSGTTSNGTRSAIGRALAVEGNDTRDSDRHRLLADELRSRTKISGQYEDHGGCSSRVPTATLSSMSDCPNKKLENSH